MWRLWCVSGWLVLLTGCATAATVRSDPQDAGRSFRFPESCEVVAAQIVPTLADLGFVLRSQESSEPCGMTVVAVKPVSAFSWGELVRVIVSPVESGSEVRVHTRRAMVTNVTARGDWSGEIYRALLQAIRGSTADDAT